MRSAGYSQFLLEGPNMAIVKKISFGVMPFAKMFRLHGSGGAAVDAVLRLRHKSLGDDYFSEVAVTPDRTAYKISGNGQLNFLHLNEENIVFTKDYFESDASFNFTKVIDEFKTIWSALNGVLHVQDVRRIGIVTELRYEIPKKQPSAWLRKNLLTGWETGKHTDKFSLRFEERSLASDGAVPDPKKADFINSIYSIYDSSIDADHPSEGFVQINVDTQRYFAPVSNSNVGDEVVKLFNKQHLPSQKRIDEKFKALGVINGSKQ